MSDDTSQQSELSLRQKQLSFKTKLIHSKYNKKRIQSRSIKVKTTSTTEAAAASKSETDFDSDSLRDIDPIQVACNNVLGQLFKVFCYSNKI